MSHPDLAGFAASDADRRRRLDAFCANVERDDEDVVARWRARTAAEHATAGAQLSDYAASVAAQNGFGGRGRLSYPALSSMLRARRKPDS